MSGIAIVLSGGAARCIAHLGVLETLSRHGIPIHSVSGTSGGALVGALYASGKYSPDDLIRLARSVHAWDITHPVLSRRGFLSSKRIARFMRSRMGDLDFDDLLLPLAVVATDLDTGKKVVIREGSVARAVQASCSLPAVFKPLDHKGRILIDGGFISQIPVRAAREDLGADFVIAVDVNFRGMEGVSPPRNSLRTIIHLASLVARKNAEEEGPLADTLIRVNVEGIGLMDFRKREDLLNRGRAAAEEAINEIIRNLKGKNLY